MKKICAKMCTQKNVQKMCTQKCAEIVHTKNAQNVHTQKCAKMCTRRICKNVHTQNLRKSVCRSFCRFVRRVVSENCVDEKFPVMHNKKFYVRETLSDMCAESFRHVCAQICTNCTCPKMCTGDNLAKCPKMTKNDQK